MSESTKRRWSWSWLVPTLLALGCAGCSKEQALNFEAFAMQIAVFFGLTIALAVNAVIASVLMKLRPRSPGAWMAMACWLLAVPALGLAFCANELSGHPDGALALFVMRPYTKVAPGWFNVLLTLVHMAFALAAGYRGMTLPEPTPDDAESDALS